MAAERVLLPPGARLVHIGPPKTGTTALQAAFHMARAEAGAQGVHYAGRDRHSAAAATAFLEQRRKTRKRSAVHWQLLRREIRASQSRCVVFSSELLSGSTTEDVARLAGDLGADKMHMVMTVRPITRILPSQWQQRVQRGSRVSWPAYLQAILQDPSGKLGSAFWSRQRHDAVAGRWAEVLGADRVTVVIVDEHDRSMLLRSFEELTGLGRGTLQPVPGLENRSLTFPEVEAVRALNTRLLDAGVSRTLLERANYSTMSLFKRRVPPPEEHRVHLPAWTFEPLATIQEEIVAGIRGLGAGIIGDLDTLQSAPRGDLVPDPAADAAPTEIPAEVAGWLASSIFEASGLAGLGDQGYRAWLLGKAVEPAGIAGTPSYRLLGVVGSRGVRTLLGPVRRLRSRARSQGG